MRIPEYPHPEHDTSDVSCASPWSSVYALVCFAASGLVIFGLVTAALARTDAHYRRDDVRNQERFVADPRSIASARKDVRL